ncbi:hypothetical protein HELRODRAFT_78799, partial [Helobdella robusta]|uniref:SGNH hydrolase-type esterase domain-containing protein n=1 Tax=Helobdella robusta TaxID=6412 RepID=T1G3G0_HELRO
MEIQFENFDVRELFDNKYVVIIGDSVTRGIYKDLVMCLSSDRECLDQQELKQKGEISFLGDQLVEGGVQTNGIEYKEIREFCTSRILLRFYFVTRCFNSYVETVLADLHFHEKPDILILNSCLWDINRYGPNGMKEYVSNLNRLFASLDLILNEKYDKTRENKILNNNKPLIIWLTTFPISSQPRGGLFTEETLSRSRKTLRLDVMQANYKSQQLALKYNINVIDMHYHFRNELDLRANDGIHWLGQGHLKARNLIIDHICKSWGVRVPKR